MLRAVPSIEVHAAERELDAVTRELRAAEASRGVTTTLRRRIEAAEARVRDCYTQLTLRALPPAELEALLAEHKATDADRDRDPGAVWNRDTFVPALLAVAVYDDPDATAPALTVDQWAMEITKGSASLGEVAALFDACWAVNDRTPDADIPKG